MSRVRTDDYDKKKRNILDVSAELFAKAGFPNVKMEDIAKACGATKSMLYHYFPTKDDLLFTMIDEHLDQVLSAVEEVVSQPLPLQERFESFIEIYTQKSAQSRQRHIIAMNDSKFLPEASVARLVEREVKITNLVAALLRELNPGLAQPLYKPYTMLLFGMLNWTDTWYKPNARLKPQELCERTSRLFLNGFLSETDGTAAPVAAEPRARAR